LRPDSRHLTTRARRSAAGGIPVALAGSLAVLMSATPAHAAGSAGSPSGAPLRVLAPTDGRTADRPSVRVPATAAPDTYVVQAGDNVSTIAARHGLRTADVLAINGLDWSSIIQPGQVLRLAAPAPEPAPAPAPAAPAVPQTTAGSYVVTAGDTISSIAARHGISVQAVFSANGLDWSSIIHPGQSIAIPASDAAAAPSVAPAAPPAPTPEPSSTYIVAAGDTMTAIAQLHGVTTQALLEANGLDRSSIIYPGQTIGIPAAASLVLVADSAPAPADASVLDAEQAANAGVIIGVGRELGVSDRGIAIALGTAMQESWLRNLDWGDRDSLGLFQQRPSTGWGTPEEVSDPARAARAFYGGPSDPNGESTRGLLDIDGWQDMSFADAAQAVQISAYPERYAQWEQPAYAWLAAHG
jgi:LysM repeat protein